MSSTALILIHATWNAVSKRSHPGAGFSLAANTLGLIILMPFAVIYRDVIPEIPLRAWGLLVLAGLFQAAYYTGLAESYRKGDLSAVYPLIRALPVVFVPVIGFALGSHGRIGGAALAGMTVVAAAGTTGYSLVDDYALSLLSSTLQADVPVPGFTTVYSFFEGALSSIWLCAIRAARL